MNNALEKLQQLLKELFQVESAADLDFGIYRIMKYKRAEVLAFIDKRLPEIVDEPLEGGALARLSAQVEERRQVTDQIREILGEDSLSPSGELKDAFHDTPLGKTYLALPPESPETGSEQLDVSIFNHLYTFFSRYYDGGDFFSKRRYSRRQKYAVPYNGEEVYLYWANSDQYYIKTGSYFLDYKYEAPNGITVRFQVVSADIERDNVKVAERRFVPRQDETVYDAEAKTLTVPFEWRPLTDAEKSLGKKQPEVDERSVKALLARFEKEPDARHAFDAERSEDAGGTPVGYLEYHLRRYTAKNTSDFFIHKDLKGFLERELDFYLKNEVLDVDDLQRWMEGGGADFVAGRFETLRVIKQIGRKIIAFLAQIEDFQKKLFEKKKFVVSTGFCLTLDNVPEDLLPEITENDAQYKEWQELFNIDEIPANLENGNGDQHSVEWLNANPYLVLDTKFFDADFKDRLLSSIEHLDEMISGLLIKGENFQALNLLQERYREQGKCIYIDPPYNTGDDGFVYKDNYQHSSWLSMINDRLINARLFNSEEGSITVSVDDIEVGRLAESLGRTYGSDNELATLVWDRNRKNDAKFFSVGHEYMLVYAKNKGLLEERKIRFREPKEGLADAKAEFERLRKEHGDDWEKVREGWMAFFDDIPQSDPRRRLMRYSKVSARGPYRDDGDVSWPGGGGPRYKVLHPVTGKPAKVPVSGWRYPTAKRFWEEYEAGKIVFGPDETAVPSKASYLFESSTQVMPSVFYSYAQTAAQEFNYLFREGRVFDNPKNWRDILRLVAYLAEDGDTTLDFFAGSGTTGHAVINLNRKNGGKRKYILVEMGEYFDSVLKKRIQKVIYSEDWRDGKPTARNSGTSHVFKYMTLESYEDALNNISFGGEGGEAALDLYGDNYLLRYMLDFETRDSETRLNIGEMCAPFNYKLILRDTSHKDGETHDLPVDLPETFAYLLGMRVQSRKTYHDGERRYLVYRGPTPERNDVTVISP